MTSHFDDAQPASNANAPIVVDFRTGMRAPRPAEQRTERPTRTGTASTVIGHDNIINALKKQRRLIVVTKTSGEQVTGLVVGNDQYTITVQEEGSSRRRVMYKHAIEEFYSDEPAASASAE